MPIRNTRFTSALYLVLFMLVALGCNRNPDEDDPLSVPKAPTPFAAGIQDFFHAPGSYWVYVDDSTGALDSTYVLSSSGGTYETSPAMQGNPSSHAKFWQIDYYSTADSARHNHFVTTSVIERNGSTTQWGYGGQPIFQLGEPEGGGYNGFHVRTFFHSLQVGANAFPNIVETEIIAAEQWLPEFDHDTQLYWSRDIGIVKRVIDLGGGQVQSWSLLRWSVTKLPG